MDPAQNLYAELRSVLYDQSGKHDVTGFQAIGVLIHLAIEVSANALIDDGVISPGQEDGDEPAA